MRALFLSEAAAREAAGLLARDGFGVEVARERFAEQDDDESWVVRTDAPVVVVELVVERFEGWLDE